MSKMTKYSKKFYRLHIAKQCKMDRKTQGAETT
jgi:hypothetical protein